MPSKKKKKGKRKGVSAPSSRCSKKSGISKGGGGADDELDDLLASLDIRDESAEAPLKSKKQLKREKMKRKNERRKQRQQQNAAEEDAMPIPKKFQLLAEEWELKYDNALRDMGELLRLAESVHSQAPGGAEEAADLEPAQHTYFPSTSGLAVCAVDETSDASPYAGCRPEHGVKLGGVERVCAPSSQDEATRLFLPSRSMTSRMHLEKKLLDLREATLPQCRDVIDRMANVVNMRASKQNQIQNNSSSPLIRAWRAYVDEFELIRRCADSVRTHPEVTDIDEIRAMHTLCAVRPFESELSRRGEY